MAYITNHLFIHRNLNIIHDMESIFLLSQGTSVLFSLSTQMAKLVSFRKACGSNRFSLKKGFTNVVLNNLLKKKFHFSINFPLSVIK